jgi:Ni,Fe-hydrogenase I cytochrome b subunit
MNNTNFHWLILLSICLVIMTAALYVGYDLINNYTLIKHCEAPVNYFHCEYRLVDF